MASRAEVWRRRLLRGRESSGQPHDPRERLLQRVVGTPSADFYSWLDAPLSPAAVLVGLIEREAGPAVLLTERALHLPRHAGQISFPGGRLNEGESVQQAALREADEEVGLSPTQVNIIDRLPDQLTGTGFAVAPILAVVAADFEPRPDPTEVASVFELPLAHIGETSRRRVAHERWGTQFVSEEFDYQGHRIWGATATILIDLMKDLDV